MIRHNHSRRGRRSPEYLTWTRMLDRCRNPNNEKWERYGGRGITVCARWHSFANFLADMGPRPEGMTLDRRDGDKGYNKTNCRWADRSTQNQNRCPFGKSSKYRGVAWDKNTERWQVRFTHRGRQHFVGRFDDQLSAAQAYDAMALETIGPDAALNFPRKRTA